MIVDEHRVANHVPRLPYEELLNCGNWRVEQAVKLMQRTLENPTSIYRLAKQLGTSVSLHQIYFNEFSNQSTEHIDSVIGLAMSAGAKIQHSARYQTDGLNSVDLADQSSGQSTLHSSLFAP